MTVRCAFCHTTDVESVCVEEAPPDTCVDYLDRIAYAPNRKEAMDVLFMAYALPDEPVTCVVCASEIPEDRLKPALGGGSWWVLDYPEKKHV